MNDDYVDWEQLYRDDFKPWDIKRPDSHLIRIVKKTPVPPGRMLEIGCGTGTNAIWLAEQGFAVTATDMSDTALRQALAKPGAERCTFIHADFLKDPLPGPDFGFVFDLGCLHGFARHDDRVLFARKVAECLAEKGLWFSIIGSADGPEMGPPRRSASDITSAVEPCFEIISLTATIMDEPNEDDREALGLPAGYRPPAWTCLMRKRSPVAAE